MRPARVAGALVEHQCPLARFVLQAGVGLPERHHVERRTNRFQRRHDLIVMPIAELRSAGHEDEHHRASSLAFLQALRHFDQRVEQVQSGLIQRPDAIDPFLQLPGVGRILREDGRPFADTEDRDFIFLSDRVWLSSSRRRTAGSASLMCWKEK